MKNVVSILNDVIGPVMTGPSSSHTAACARIGLITRQLYGKEINNAEIIFEETGSYPNTYIGQGSNYGFIGGLLGFAPEDPKLKDSIEIAAKSGKKITFKKMILGETHPNTAKINILGEDGSIEMSVMTYSTGGGMFEIRSLDGFPVLIKGDRKKIFILCKCGEVENSLENILKKARYKKIIRDNRAFFDITPTDEFDEESIIDFSNEEDVLFYRVARRILPVQVDDKDKPLFINGKEALEYNSKQNMKLWELAIKYETTLGNISSKEVIEKMKFILNIMRQSTMLSENLSDDFGFIKPTAKIMENNFKSKKVVDIGVLNKVIARSTAVMENNCRRGIIVAAPTAGSCGVIPATIITIGEELGFDDNKIIEALLSAGIVGAFIGNQATFGAETAGCQAENGSASAMAAAGVTYLLGGQVEDCFKASSLALQNLLGLICDPIAGLAEIPCINRNAVAATNAIISANMVIAGFEPIIPLDETILAMAKTGERLPSELRCTCLGGLCETETAKRITKDISKKWAVL